MKDETKIAKPNQLRALLGLARASFIASLRNKTTVFFNFFFPFIFITLFGVLNGGNVTFDVGVRPGSVTTGPFYEALSEISSFHLITDKTNTEFDEMLNKGEIPAVLTINKTGSLEMSPDVSVPKYYVKIERSGADPDNAATVTNIIQTVVQKFNMPPQVDQYKSITAEEVVIQGRKFEQIDFILPGQLAFALLTNALFGISFAFMTLKKELVIKRIFASPVSHWTLIFGEVLSRMVMAVLQALIIVLAGHYLFGFTLSHGWVTVLSLIALSVLGILVFLSFGLLIPSIAKDENAVAPISNLIMMPQLFLSGAFFPIELFPKFIQPIAQILPMTFLNEAFKMVAFNGMALWETYPQILGLFVWGVVLYLIDIKLFKWE